MRRPWQSLVNWKEVWVVKLIVGSLITYYLTSVLTNIGLNGTLSRIIAGVNGTTYFLTRYVVPSSLALPPDPKPGEPYSVDPT